MRESHDYMIALQSNENQASQVEHGQNVYGDMRGTGSERGGEKSQKL